MEIVAVNPRELILAAAPRFGPEGSLKTLFCIVAQRSGLSPRVVRAAWAGEPVGSKSINKLREAAGDATQREAHDLAARLDAMAERIRQKSAPQDESHLAALDEVASILRRMAAR